MCGICGFNWEDKSLIKRMCDVIEHRGPDDHGYYVDNTVSLGNRRLSIIDLKKGKQPIFNEGKSIVIVFNGEIYNYQEIRKKLELSGHKFLTNSDTETIVHAYEGYGEKCLQLFNGMFAIAIWDKEKKKLFLARDRLGIKPLYYYFKDNKFVFASEMKSIIQDEEIKRRIDYKGLIQFITYGYTINGDTLLKDFKELMPGHHLTYSNNKIEIKKYWDLELKLEKKNIQFYASVLRKKLEESVKKRLISDVPLGASLSGGIDSSVVVAIMSKLKKDPIKTFTIGFNDPIDEFKKARSVAEYFNTDHKEIYLTFKDINKEFVKILWHMEVPYGRPAVLPTYFLAEGTKKKVTVSLVGEGSDEIFAGYNRYQIYMPIPHFSFEYLKNRFNFNFYLKTLYYNILPREKKVNEISSGYFKKKKERENIFSKEISDKLEKEKNIINTFSSYLSKFDRKEHLNACLLFEIKTELQNIQLIRVDRMSMAHAVEMRVPFLDYELVEFSMTIPSICKWNGLNKKYVLQKAVSDLLPKDVISRKKMPFSMPLSNYFNKEFIIILKNILTDSNIRKRNYLKNDYISKMINKLIKTKNMEDNNLRQLLFLTNLELWNKLFIENDKVYKPNLALENYF